ncbi:hypothetical protein BDR07DRAFT_958890 [Suillus spraguei]|nr:hypothetical protein BDR07DRAFT_958890 [Suillus spraguei]
MCLCLPRPKSPLMNLQLMSSSWLGQTIGQDSMKLGLQSCLEYPERVYDRIDCPHEELVEIYNRITELLSEIPMEDEGMVDSGVDLHTFVDDEHQAIMPLALNEVNTVSPSLAPPELSILAESLVFQGQFLDLEHGPLGFTSSLQEGGGLPQGNSQYAQPFLQTLTMYEQTCCSAKPLVSSAMSSVCQSSCLRMIRTLKRCCPSPQLDTPNHVLRLCRGDKLK